MEISSIRGYNELGIEDPSFINQWHMNSLDHHLSLPQLVAVYGDTINHPFSHPTFTHKVSAVDASLPSVVRPTKQLKSNGYNTKTDHLSTPQHAFEPVLPFIDSNHTNQLAMAKPKEEHANNLLSDMLVSQGSFGGQNFAFKACQGAKRISTSSRIPHGQDHIIAERKRREKLSQRFIALSAAVPGLKKTDKATVLGDAIKYLKHLQERVKTLEEQTSKKTMESAVIVKKSQLFVEGENSTSDKSSSGGPFNEPLPEIEARFCDKHVLIRIHCEKRKGVLEKLVAEIENLHLSVTNSSVLTFGSSALDVTIIAQMDLEFSLSVKDLVKNLRSALELFI